MAVNSLNLNDLIFNGLVRCIDSHERSNISQNRPDLSDAPTSSQLNDRITRLLRFLFPINCIQEKARNELQVSVKNIVSIFSLQLDMPNRLAKYNLSSDIMEDNGVLLTNEIDKPVEKLAKIKAQSDYTIEKGDVSYDQHVNNIFCEQSPEIMPSLELKNHVFVLRKTDNQVCDIQQIVQPMLQYAYNRFCTFKSNKSMMSIDAEETLNRLSHLLTCALFILWSKAHGKILEGALWNYWFRFVIILGLICVLLDAYYRRITKTSGVLRILSEKFTITLLPDITVCIDNGQLKEKLAEDILVASENYDSINDSLGQMNIDKKLAEFLQDLNNNLKMIDDEPTAPIYDEKEIFIQKSIYITNKSEAPLCVVQKQRDLQANTVTNQLYFIKCALGFVINKYNDDSRFDSYARVSVLYIFGLDLRNVAEAISQQDEVVWSDKRINKALIMTSLRTAESNKEKAKETTFKLNLTEQKKNEWTMDDDMAGIAALMKFNLTLFDLRRYFYYDDHLFRILQSISSKPVEPSISSLNSDESPTFCNEKTWRIIERCPEARKALEIHHNYRSGWELVDVLSVKLVRLGFGKKGTGRLVAATDDRNTVRVLVHVGNHNTYMMYQMKAHAGVVAAYGGSEEKNKTPNLTFVDYLRLIPNTFNVATRIRQKSMSEHKLTM